MYPNDNETLAEWRKRSSRERRAKYGLTVAEYNEYYLDSVDRYWFRGITERVNRATEIPARVLDSWWDALGGDQRATELINHELRGRAEKCRPADYYTPDVKRLMTSKTGRVLFGA